MPIRVVGPRDALTLGELVINTTSRSNTWSRGLSPFFLGPVPLYEGAVVPQATNVENAWQFSKVYRRDMTPEGDPAPSYFEWAAAGWSDTRAHRYPMGKGVIPEYTWWAGQKLDYVTARKKVYMPRYAHAVVQSEAYTRLETLYRAEGQLTLWDFDGYDYTALGRTLKEAVNDPKRKLGHAFVLAYLLEGLP